MSYKWWIIVATSLFTLGIVLGLATPSGIIETLAEDLTTLQEQLGSILTLPGFLLAILIFANNFFTIVMSFCLSPILCLVPVLVLIINGWVIAIVSLAVVSEKSIGFVLAGLIPHGIFEVPALIMGEAAALSSGTMIIVALFKKDYRNSLVPGLKQNLKYLAIAIALLVPAAIIETHISPTLLDG